MFKPAPLLQYNFDHPYNFNSVSNDVHECKYVVLSDDINTLGHGNSSSGYFLLHFNIICDNILDGKLLR